MLDTKYVIGEDDTKTNVTNYTGHIVAVLLIIVLLLAIMPKEDKGIDINNTNTNTLTNVHKNGKIK